MYDQRPPSSSLNVQRLFYYAWNRRFLTSQAIHRTVGTALRGTSYTVILALVDCLAWVRLIFQHRSRHAESVAAALCRLEGCQPAHLNENTFLLTAAIHSKAAYGKAAWEGYLDSWHGFAWLLTAQQFTRNAVRNFTRSQHVEAVVQMTELSSADDIVQARWHSEFQSPAYYVCFDRKAHAIIVSVRGTLQLGDFTTVLDAVPSEVELFSLKGYAHGGVLASAHGMLDDVLAAMELAARRAPKGSTALPVLLCGHSLGGGVSALLACMLNEKRTSGDKRMNQFGAIFSIGIGSAASLCAELTEISHRFVTSIIYGADALPLFSVNGARDIIDGVHEASIAAQWLSWCARLSGQHALQNAACKQAHELRKAFKHAEQENRSNTSDVAELLYPPGRLLWLLPPKRQYLRHALYEASLQTFDNFLLLGLLGFETAHHHGAHQYLVGLRDIFSNEGNRIE